MPRSHNSRFRQDALYRWKATMHSAFIMLYLSQSDFDAKGLTSLLAAWYGIVIGINRIRFPSSFVILPVAKHSTLGSVWLASKELQISSFFFILGELCFLFLFLYWRKYTHLGMKRNCFSRSCRWLASLRLTPRIHFVIQRSKTCVYVRILASVIHCQSCFKFGRWKPQHPPD